MNLREQVKWAPDSWHHLSLSWKQASGSLFWALDIDGKRFLGMYGGSVGKRPAGKESPTQAFKVLHFAPEGYSGPFDAMVDNLRISKVARYPDPHREQRSLDFEPDRDRRVIGPVTGRMPPGRERPTRS